MKQFKTSVQYDHASDTHYIILPDELLDAVGLVGGDIVEWVDNNDGSWSINRAESSHQAPVQLELPGCIITSDQPWINDQVAANSAVYAETTNGLVSITPVKAGWSAQFILTT